MTSGAVTRARGALLTVATVAFARAHSYNMLLVGQSQMDDEYDKEYRDSYKPALSVLFNFFIMAQVSGGRRARAPSCCLDSVLGRGLLPSRTRRGDVSCAQPPTRIPQVANAFVSRRYNYELDFFRGILNSPIFLTIMFLITVMQVIIMQTPISYVFKVRLRGTAAMSCTSKGKRAARAYTSQPLTLASWVLWAHPGAAGATPGRLGVAGELWRGLCVHPVFVGVPHHDPLVPAHFGRPLVDQHPARRAHGADCGRWAHHVWPHRVWPAGIWAAGLGRQDWVWATWWQPSRVHQGGAGGGSGGRQEG